ncbi:anti-sigma factor [uncultured Corynebacterium sp.]|uniref:anti-sigma factor n=1 Tax=uncultured Corynebacterium sp. TaxID=159447 RepID=UPI0026297A07|nr:anti-sigma factor [uncultured Corynebacterium sp.]
MAEKNTSNSSELPDAFEEALAQYAEPVAPPVELKGSIMSQLDDFPQRAASIGEPEGAPVADTDFAEVIDLSDRRKASADGGFRRSWMVVSSIAAALVLVAGVGVFVVWPDDDAGSESSIVVSAEKANSGTNTMHEIMAAKDVRSASFSADGATLDVVVSEDMNKGGAMVNGAPQLDDGMGAQVWSIDSAGRARSAGVIGQEPHTDVWMPLPADTMAVKVTVEPMAGEESPKGAVLASVEL